MISHACNITNTDQIETTTTTIIIIDSIFNTEPYY